MMDAATPGTMAAPRRRGLLAAAAGVGLLAGAGVAWWRFRASEGEGGDDAGIAQMWQSEFDTPQGAKLAMASFKGKPLLVNFWATWCAPCVEEMPLLDRFYREHAANGWQIVGLAIDQPSSVRKFLERTAIAYPIGLAGMGGTELTRALGNVAGGLPFSVLVGADGRVRQRRMGRLSAADLQAWSGQG